MRIRIVARMALAVTAIAAMMSLAAAAEEATPAAGGST